MFSYFNELQLPYRLAEMCPARVPAHLPAAHQPNTTLSAKRPVHQRWKLSESLLHADGMPDPAPRRDVQLQGHASPEVRHSPGSALEGAAHHWGLNGPSKPRLWTRTSSDFGGRWTSSRLTLSGTNNELSQQNFRANCFTKLMCKFVSGLICNFMIFLFF